MITVAIIQARMKSERLPDKVLMDIEGKPMLARVWERVSSAHICDEVVIATSDLDADTPIANYCKEHDIPCFRGEHDDVLKRYYDAALAHKAEVIVRFTADCPLLDPEIIRRVVQAFDPKKHDYISNVLPPTYPDGLDTEVFSFATLKRAHEEVELPSEREHVTTYIQKHLDQFRIANVENGEDLSKLRWTVDREKDCKFVQKVYAHFANQSFGMNEVLTLLEEHPDLGMHNKTIERNEGHASALEADKEFLSKNSS